MPNSATNASADSASAQPKFAALDCFQSEQAFRLYFSNENFPLPEKLTQPAIIYTQENGDAFTITFLEAAFYLRESRIIRNRVLEYFQEIKNANLVHTSIRLFHSSLLETLLNEMPAGWFTQLQENGLNVLQLAAQVGNLDAIDKLLANPEVLDHVNDMDTKGLTALSYAMMNRNKENKDDAIASRYNEIINKLLAVGANPALLPESNDPYQGSTLEWAALLEDPLLFTPSDEEEKKLKLIREQNEYSLYLERVTAIIDEIYGIGFWVGIKKITAAALNQPQSQDLSACIQFIRTTPMLNTLVNQNCLFDSTNTPSLPAVTELHKLRHAHYERSSELKKHHQNRDSDLARLIQLSHQLRQELANTQFFEAFRSDPNVIDDLKVFVECPVNNKANMPCNQMPTEFALSVHLYGLAKGISLRVPLEKNPRLHFDLLKMALIQFPRACTAVFTQIGPTNELAFGPLTHISAAKIPSTETMTLLRRLLTNKEFHLLQNFFTSETGKRLNFTINYQQALIAQEKTQALFAAYSQAASKMLKKNDIVISSGLQSGLAIKEIEAKTKILIQKFKDDWCSKFIVLFWATMLHSYQVQADENSLQQAQHAERIARAAMARVQESAAESSPEVIQQNALKAAEAVLTAFNLYRNVYENNFANTGIYDKPVFENELAFHQYFLSNNSQKPEMLWRLDMIAFIDPALDGAVPVSFAQAAAWLNISGFFKTDLEPYTSYLLSEDILEIAIRSHSQDVFKILFAHLGFSHQRNPMFTAAQSRNIEAMQHMLTQGGLAHIDETDDLGNTALAYAVMNRDLAMIKLLVDNGANPHVIDLKHPGNPTAFAFAAVTGKRDLLAALDGGKEKLEKIRLRKEYAAYAKDLKYTLEEFYAWSILIAAPLVKQGLENDPDIISHRGHPASTLERGQADDIKIANAMITDSFLLQKLCYAHLQKPIALNFENLTTRQEKTYLFEHAEKMFASVLNWRRRLHEELKEINFSHSNKVRYLYKKLTGFFEQREFFQAYRNDPEAVPRFGLDPLTFAIGNSTGTTINARFDKTIPVIITLFNLDTRLRADLPVNLSEAYYAEIERALNTLPIIPRVSTVNTYVQSLRTFNDRAQFSVNTLPTAAGLKEAGVSAEESALLLAFFRGRTLPLPLCITTGTANLVCAKSSELFHCYGITLESEMALKKHTQADKDRLLKIYRLQFEKLFWETVAASQPVKAWQAERETERLAKTAKAASKANRRALKKQSEATSAASPVVVLPAVAPTPDVTLTAIVEEPKPALPIPPQKIIVRKALSDAVWQKVLLLKKQFVLLEQLTMSALSNQASSANFSIQMMRFFVQCITLAKSDADFAQLLNAYVPAEDYENLTLGLQLKLKLGETAEELKQDYSRCNFMFTKFFALFDELGCYNEPEIPENCTTKLWEEINLAHDAEALIALIMTHSQAVFETITDEQGHTQLQILDAHITHTPSFHIIRIALVELLQSLLLNKPNYLLSTNDRQIQGDFSVLFLMQPDALQETRKQSLIEFMTQTLLIDTQNPELTRALVFGLYQSTLTTFCPMPEAITPLFRSLSSMQTALKDINDKTAATLTWQLMNCMSQLVTLSKDPEMAAFLNRHLTQDALEGMRNWMQDGIQLPTVQLEMKFNIPRFNLFFQAYLQPLLDSIAPTAEYENVKTLGTTPPTPPAIEWGEVKMPINGYQAIACIKAQAEKTRVALNEDDSQINGEISFIILRAALIKFLQEFEAIKTYYNLHAKSDAKVQKCFEMLFDNDLSKRNPKFLAALRKELSEERVKPKLIQILTDMVCQLSERPRSKIVSRLVDEDEVEASAIDPVLIDDKIVLFTSKTLLPPDPKETAYINMAFTALPVPQP